MTATILPFFKPLPPHLEEGFKRLDLMLPKPPAAEYVRDLAHEILMLSENMLARAEALRG